MALSTIMITNQEDGFLRDIWYFAVRSDELKLGRLLSLKLLGEPIVLAVSYTHLTLPTSDLV